MLAALVTLAVISAFASTLQADVVLDREFPTQGEPTRVRVVNRDGNVVAGAAVSVAYRPGSAVTREEDAGETGADGSLLWTPTDAGIATVTATWEAPDGSDRTSAVTVSVKFRSVPATGILIMLVAGLLLIVGSFVRVAILLRTPKVSE